MYARLPSKYIHRMDLPTLGKFIDNRFQEMRKIAEGGLHNLSTREVKEFQVRNEELSEARSIFVGLTNESKGHHKNCAAWTSTLQGKQKPCDCGFVSMSKGKKKSTLFGIPIVESESVPPGKILMLGSQQKNFHICEGDENCAAEGVYLTKVKGQAGTHEEGRVLLCSSCMSAATANGLIEGTYIPGSKPVIQKQHPIIKPVIQHATSVDQKSEPKREVPRTYQPKRRKFGMGE